MAHACPGRCELPDLGFEFSMAFQPIVDVPAQRIFAYEALVRGINGEPAGEVLQRINDQNRYAFDQCCRRRAIQLAASLHLDTYLSINFLPNAVYQPETCIRATLAAASEFNFPKDKLIFEVTEGEKVENKAHLQNIICEYKRLGFKTAIDDFGAGYAGLNLLAEFQPDIIKIDMDLTQGIESDLPRQAIVRSIVMVCRELNIEIIAEGVESRAELEVLRGFGICLFQGFYLARPAFEALPAVDWGAIA
ncbi:MAG: EAL domain-containing protein [Cyanobacteria bacterium]|nr:EAL domain-containing protein [Cyanobacteriota bacterium]